ncbi:MAG: methyltransferase domain-containing protein [Deltaproteobacteria bacterium]|nr:methyltransferase domain-containing protein [Deltaproteobacteria bacterium]
MRRLVATEVERSLARLERAFGPASSRTEPRSGDRAFEPDEVARLYGKRAARYDFESRLYRLIGFRIDRYRQMAVDALALQPGATVVEIGCGTGANFPLLERAVGRAGRIIGVDLTEAMLEQARRRVLLEGWPNVELVRTDAASFGFPSGVNGILSTFALTLSPEFDAIIARGARALAPGGRWVVLDMKMPDDWPPWLVRAAVALARPYGVTLGAGVRHPWDSFSRCLPRSWMRELYLGAAFLAVGVAGQRPS